MPPGHVPPLRAGRYALYGEIAAGGMATVLFGRLAGPGGFSRTVAVKRLHPQFAKDPEFAAMFLDEARLAGRIHHPNVVPTLDVVATETSELFLVLEYVHGESLSRLARAALAQDGRPMPVKIAGAVICGALLGLHAAHEATNDAGDALDIVHRDVSPQNILVGADGVARVLDFGVAKAVGRSHMTRDGQVKGKLAYMSPEQLRREIVDRRADIYASGVVLWELLTGARLFTADDEGGIVDAILECSIAKPSAKRSGGGVPPALDDVVMRALSARPADRFGTARQMALALEAACEGVASAPEVGEWVQLLAEETLSARARARSEIERLGDEASALPPAPSSANAASAPSSARRAEDGPASQVSTIAVSKPGSVVRAPRARWSMVAAFVVGLAVASGAFTIAVSTRGAPEAAGGTPAAPIETPPRETLSDPPPPPPPPPSPPAPALSPAALLADPAATSSGPSPRAPGRALPRHRPAPASSGARCAVRSYVDDAGVKHYFDDCAPPR